MLEIKLISELQLLNMNHNGKVQTKMGYRSINQQELLKQKLMDNIQSNLETWKPKCSLQGSQILSKPINPLYIFLYILILKNYQAILQ